MHWDRRLHNTIWNHLQLVTMASGMVCWGNVLLTDKVFPVHVFVCYPSLCTHTQGVVHLPVISGISGTVVGTITAMYSVIYPFRHENNNLSSLFRDRWAKVSWF